MRWTEIDSVHGGSYHSRRMKSETRGLRAMIINRLGGSRVYTQPQYWDAKAEEFGSEGASGWINQNLNTIYHEREVALLLSSFPDANGLDVLDAGCGTGRISRHFAGRGGRVVGIDFSGRAIELARQRKTDNPPSYRVQSVLELADERQFDIAVTFGVLCVACWDEAALVGALANLYRALRPGGKLLLAEPLHRGPLGLSLRMGAGRVVAMMREAGFSIESVVPLHFWPISRPLAYFPFSPGITSTMYRLGEAILRKANRPALGDYKIIRALRPAAT